MRYLRGRLPGHGAGGIYDAPGTPVELVNRNRAHVEALRAGGARIRGTVEMTVPVRALLPEEMEGPYDVIILLTKQLHNREVVTFLKPLLAPDGVIVTLQNGIPEPGIAEIVGQEHTMGCVVEWGATLSAPGECVLTSAPTKLSFHMGRMQGISDEKFCQVKSLLEQMCPVYTEDNLIGARWTKLLINATFSGLGTVVGGLFGNVSEDRDVRPVALPVHEGVHGRWVCGGGAFRPRFRGRISPGFSITKMGLKRPSPWR